MGLLKYMAMKFLPILRQNYFVLNGPLNFLSNPLLTLSYPPPLLLLAASVDTTGFY
jgi:hypothetical protein